MNDLMKDWMNDQMKEWVRELVDAGFSMRELQILQF